MEMLWIQAIINIIGAVVAICKYAVTNQVICNAQHLQMFWKRAHLPNSFGNVQLAESKLLITAFGRDFTELVYIHTFYVPALKKTFQIFKK